MLYTQIAVTLEALGHIKCDGRKPHFDTIYRYNSCPGGEEEEDEE